MSAMEAVLEAEHDSVEDAARAALQVAEEIFEKRCKFTVVGQLTATKEHSEIDPRHPDAIKVALGFYSTLGDAQSAAERLWHSTASGDTFRTWVLPTFHGTAADLHDKRKQQYAEAEEKAAAAARDKFKASIEKRELEAAARAGGGKGSCECGHAPYEHQSAGSSRGKCGLSLCNCEKWRERK